MPFLFFVSAILIAFAATPAAGVLGARWGAVDHPDSRKVHGFPVPRLGGAAIFAAFFLSCAVYLWLFQPFSREGVLGRPVPLLVGAALLVFALGVFDDIKGANAPVKLTVQVVAALLVVWNGDVIRTVTSPAGGSIELGVLAVPATILWLVGVTNAFNLIDGADGVAAGVGAIVAGTMALVGAYSGQEQSAVLAAALCGALLGFLRFNFHPARIFMGDSGALFIGFVLAVLAIRTSQVSTTTVSFLTPVVALGLPIMDTSLSVFRRVRAGRNPFRADKEHIHHELLRETLSHRWTAVTVYILCILLNVAALVLLYRNDWRFALWVVPATLLVAASPRVRRRLRLTGNGNGNGNGSRAFAFGSRQPVPAGGRYDVRRVMDPDKKKAAAP